MEAGWRLLSTEQTRTSPGEPAWAIPCDLLAEDRSLQALVLALDATAPEDVSAALVLDGDEVPLAASGQVGVVHLSLPERDQEKIRAGAWQLVLRLNRSKPNRPTTGGMVELLQQILKQRLKAQRSPADELGVLIFVESSVGLDVCIRLPLDAREAVGSGEPVRRAAVGQRLMATVRLDSDDESDTLAAVESSIVGPDGVERTVPVLQPPGMAPNASPIRALLLDGDAAQEPGLYVMKVRSRVQTAMGVWATRATDLVFAVEPEVSAGHSDLEIRRRFVDDHEMWQVAITPRNRLGRALGSGWASALELIGGEITTEVSDAGDGSYLATVPPPGSNIDGLGRQLLLRCGSSRLTLPIPPELVWEDTWNYIPDPPYSPEEQA